MENSTKSLIACIMMMEINGHKYYIANFINGQKLIIVKKNYASKYEIIRIK